MPGRRWVKLRLRDALEKAFRASREFSLKCQQYSGNIGHTIPTHVSWEQAGNRTRVFYAVEFTSSGNSL